MKVVLGFELVCLFKAIVCWRLLFTIRLFLWWSFFLSKYVDGILWERRWRFFDFAKIICFENATAWSGRYIYSSWDSYLHFHFVDFFHLVLMRLLQVQTGGFCCSASSIAHLQYRTCGILRDCCFYSQPLVYEQLMLKAFLSLVSVLFSRLQCSHIQTKFSFL